MPRHTLPGAVGRLSAAPPRAGTVACSVCLLVLLVCLSAWVAECGAQSQSVGSGSGVGNDTQCRDKGNGKWHSSTRGTCKRLVQLDYCTKDGKRGAKWIPKWGNVSHWANQDVFYGMDMLEACCGCGGGISDTCAHGHNFDEYIPYAVMNTDQLGPTRAISSCLDLTRLSIQENLTINALCGYLDLIVATGSEATFGESAVSSACACTCGGRDDAQCQNCTVMDTRGGVCKGNRGSIIGIMKYNLGSISQKEAYVCCDAEAVVVLVGTIKKQAHDGLGGCVFSLAHNYNPVAWWDDGSCIFKRQPACADPVASNYNARSVVSYPGVCEYRDVSATLRSHFTNMSAGPNAWGYVTVVHTLSEFKASLANASTVQAVMLTPPPNGEEFAKETGYTQVVSVGPGVLAVLQGRACDTGAVRDSTCEVLGTRFNGIVRMETESAGLVIRHMVFVRKNSYCVLLSAPLLANTVDGVLGLTASKDILLENLVFINNTAYRGGAIMFRSEQHGGSTGSLTVRRTRFINNRALYNRGVMGTGNGGAIYVVGPTTDKNSSPPPRHKKILSIEGCFFSGNTAPNVKTSAFTSGGDAIRLSDVRNWSVLGTMFTPLSNLDNRCDNTQLRTKNTPELQCSPHTCLPTEECWQNHGSLWCLCKPGSGRQRYKGSGCWPCEQGQARSFQDTANFRNRFRAHHNISLANTDVCITCPVGKQPDLRKLYCEDCATLQQGNVSCFPQNVTLTSSRCLPCATLPCLVNSECNNSMRVKTGWHLHTPRGSERSYIATVLKCPAQARCTASNGSAGNTRCDEGYDGPLCAVCRFPDYYRSSNTCIRCGAIDDWRYYFLLLVICGPLGVISWTAWGRVKEQKRLVVSMDMAILQEGLQGAEMISTRNQASETTEPDTDSGTTTPPKSSRYIGMYICFKMISMPMRITVSFFQVATQLHSVLHFTYPPVIQKSFMDHARFFALDVISVMRPQCHGYRVNFYMEWVVAVYVMPAVGLLLLMLRYCCSIREKRTKRFTLNSNIQTLVFFFYTPVTSLAFQVFNCRVLSLVPKEEVLYHNYDIACNTPTHDLYKYMAYFIIVIFVVGMPVVQLGLAFLNYLQLDEAGDRTEVALVNRLSDKHGLSASAADTIWHYVRPRNGKRRTEHRYRHGLDWWEAVDMLRKASLVGLVTCLEAGSVKQAFLASFLALFWFILQIRVRPYRFAEDQQYQTAVDLAIFVTILTTLVLRQDEGTDADVQLRYEDDSHKFFETYLLVALCVLVPAPALFGIICKLLRLQVRAKVDAGKPLNAFVVEVLGRSMLQQFNDPLFQPSQTSRAIAMCQCGVATPSELLLLQSYVCVELRSAVVQEQQETLAIGNSGQRETIGQLSAAQIFQAVTHDLRAE